MPTISTEQLELRYHMTTKGHLRVHGSREAVDAARALMPELEQPFIKLEQVSGFAPGEKRVFKGGTQLRNEAIEVLQQMQQGTCTLQGAEKLKVKEERDMAQILGSTTASFVKLDEGPIRIASDNLNVMKSIGKMLKDKYGFTILSESKAREEKTDVISKWRYGENDEKIMYGIAVRHPDPAMDAKLEKTLKAALAKGQLLENVWGENAQFFGDKELLKPKTKQKAEVEKPRPAPAVKSPAPAPAAEPVKAEAPAPVAPVAPVIESVTPAPVSKPVTPPTVDMNAYERHQARQREETMNRRAAMGKGLLGLCGAALTVVGLGFLWKNHATAKPASPDYRLAEIPGADPAFVQAINAHPPTAEIAGEFAKLLKDKLPQFVQEKGGAQNAAVVLSNFANTIATEIQGRLGDVKGGASYPRSDVERSMIKHIRNLHQHPDNYKSLGLKDKDVLDAIMQCQSMQAIVGTPSNAKGR